MIRALLDTNVIVSSLLQPAGIPNRIVEAWRADQFALCLSEPLLQELQEVLRRPPIKRAVHLSPDQRGRFLDLLAKTSIFFDGELAIEPVIPEDPDDDVVLATALATHADLIVSGDAHLLRLGQHKGIPILTPRQFLQVLSETTEG